LDSRLSTSYNSLTRYESTIEIYENYKDCKFCNNDKYYKLYGLILGSAVTAFSNIQKYDQALEINKKIINLFEKSSELILRRYAIKSRIEGGRILIRANRLNEAEVNLNELISLCKKDYTNYKDLIIDCLGAKSELFEKKSDMNGSLGCLLEIDNIYKDEQENEMNNTLRSGNLMTISDYYSNVYDYKSALVYSKKAVECHDKSNVRDYTKSMIYSRLSMAFWDLDSIDASFAAYEKAIAWNDEIYGENSVYNLIPITSMSVLTSNSHFDQSIEISRKGLKILKNSKEYQLGAEQLFETMSNVYSNPNYEKRNQDSSLNYAMKYRDYVSYHLSENSEQYLNSIQQIGYLYFQYDDFEKAIPYAIEYKDRILKILGTDHYLYRSALNSLAMDYQQGGKIAEAEVIRLELAKCWNKYIKDNYIALVGNLQNNRGIIEAIDYSIYFVEKNLNFLKLDESKSIPYENLLLIKNLQLGSLQSLRNNLQKNDQLSSKLNLYYKLKTSNISKEDQLKISQLETELLANSKIFREIQEGKALKHKDISKSLKSGQVFIDFARIADPINQDFKYLAIIVDGNSTTPQYVDCGLEKKFLNHILNKDMNGLYLDFWQQIEKHIPKESNEIILSPIYELNNVSFAAICDNKGKTKNNVENQYNRGVIIGSNVKEYLCNYLIDKYRIRYVQSARSLLKENLTLKTKSSLLALGGVNYNNVNSEKNKKDEKSKETEETNDELYESILANRKLSNFSEFGFLPNTEIEVDQIGTECKEKSWKAEILKGSEADESNLIKSLSNNSFEVLHFSTHGFSIPENLAAEIQTDPLNRCGLVLAGGNKSWESRENADKMIKQYGHDGILTGNEVLNLPISESKLVVLSACETSLGKIQGMESSQSLSRMFLMSGVDCVISSIWPVPDKETMELMTLFYSDLTNSSNPVASFEKAQKEMRAKYPTDPEKWAGFVLVR
jgi:CHAT domain-containing protein